MSRPVLLTVNGLLRSALYLAAASLHASDARAVEFYPTGSSPQAAINTAQAAGGGLVRFPCGTTTLTGPLAVTGAGVTLEGCGPGGTILEANFEGDILTFGAPGSPPAQQPIPCGGVRDLTIASTSTRTSGFAIAIKGCQQGDLTNLRLRTKGGGGIVLSTAFPGLFDTAAPIFFVRAVDIQIEGSFTALRIDGSSNRYFTGLKLRGNRAAGSRGIEITESRNDGFKDIEVRQFETGVRIAPTAFRSVSGAHFDAVISTLNAQHGFHYLSPEGGPIVDVSCARCEASSNDGRGFQIDHGSGLTFVDARATLNGVHGFEAGASASDVSIRSGIFGGNCAAIPNGCQGILMTGTQGFRIQGVRAGAAAGLPNRQASGVCIWQGANFYVISGNDLGGNMMGGFTNLGAGANGVVAENLQ